MTRFPLGSRPWPASLSQDVEAGGGLHVSSRMENDDGAGAGNEGHAGRQREATAHEGEPERPNTTGRCQEQPGQAPVPVTMPATVTMPVQTTLRDEVLWVCIDRPSRLNAIDGCTLEGITDALRRADADEGVRAVVVHGGGERAFSVGADLKERAGMSDEEVRARLDAYGFLLHALRTLSVPSCAAVHGYALGGGFELALACDFCVATRDAVFGLPEVGLGVIPGAGGSQLLARLVGKRRALAWMLRGERLSAQALLEAGAVNLVVEEAVHLQEAVRAWLQPMVDAPRAAVREALHTVRVGAEQSLDEGLRVERSAYERLLLDPARKEKLEAFAQRAREKG